MSIIRHHQGTNMQTKQTRAATTQYHLPDADRQAILAQSDSAQTNREIEYKRRQFLKTNDDEFGQKIIQNTQLFTCSSY